jgi:fatty acid desaturase
MRFIATINQSLLGRMLLGPFLSIFSLLQMEVRALRSGDFSHVGYWILHILAITPLIYWVIAICEMSILKYLLCFALPGTSLALVRSFCEHVPARKNDNRTRAVEDAGPLAWLFLFNNLHILHHQSPELPWYALPSIYYSERSRLLKESGHTPLRNYGEVFRRYFWRIKDSPVSPIS